MIDSSGKWAISTLLIVLWSGLLCTGCGSSPKETMESLVQQVRTGESDRIVVTEALIQDNDLALLANLDGLVHVSIQECRVTDEGLRHLAGLGNLEH